MPRLAVIGLAGLAFVASVTPATAAQDALAKTALQTYLKTSDAAATTQAVTGAREKLQQLAVTDPTTTAAASILLSRGLDTAGVARIVNRAKAVPVEVEIKTPTADGRVMTAWAFQPAFEEFNGTLNDRLDYILARQRVRFLERAGQVQAADPAAAARLRQAAESRELKFYRVEVLGTPAQLKTLLAEADVAAAFVDADPDRVRPESLQKARAGQNSTARARVPIVRNRRKSDGPPPMPQP